MAFTGTEAEQKGARQVPRRSRPVENFAAPEYCQVLRLLGGVGPEETVHRAGYRADDIWHLAGVSMTGADEV